MIKQFATIKVGYSKGIYGCTAEYFTTIWIDKTGMNAMHFQGLYGVEERVAREFKSKGYEQAHIFSEYGKLTRKDMIAAFVSEKIAIEMVKTRVK